jgi:hypothetical protein
MRWCGARIRDGARWAAAGARAGASRAAVRGKQAALSAGVRVREGALWTAARAKDGAAWSARKIAALGRFTWDRAVLPGVNKAASGAGQAGARIKSDSLRFAEGARARVTVSGAWSAKLPGTVWAKLLMPGARYALDRGKAVKNIVIDARKRHAEAGAAAQAAREEAKNRAETERQAKAAAEETAGPKPVAADAPEPLAASKKRKQAKANRDSVEV